MTFLVLGAHSAPLPLDLLSTSELSFFVSSDSLPRFSSSSLDTFSNDSRIPWDDPQHASSRLLHRASSDSDAATLATIKTIRDRRLPIIAQDVNDPLVGTVSDISDWISTLGDDGKWPNFQVNYTTGCQSQKANWPARLHWQRIALMAAAWHGGIDGADQFVNNSSLLDAITRAMGFWFSNDFTDSSCLAGQCACSAKGLWNPNWFSNVISIPVLVGQSCLLLGEDTLAKSQLSGCTQITGRAVGALLNGVSGMGQMTGANALDVARVTIDSGLLTNSISIIEQGYKHVHNEVVLRNQSRSDGIRADGSFSQHSGLLYNGNYGKDYANDVLALEITAGGTDFSAVKASPESQAAYEKLWEADLWMIYRNVKTNVLHFDFSVLNRFITFPVADDQATGSIHINIDRVKQLGDLWGSQTLQSAFASLNGSGSDANSGNLTGNRMFYTNDYMVQRGGGYVTTLKMFSSRTPNSECINDQNPFGFHLSDGTLYTYVDGTQYEDIAGAWDWNMIPGTTTDYAASKLSCDQSRLYSKKDFVGGASDGNIGAAAMSYTNPKTGALSFQKAWFFLNDDVQHVMISHVESSSKSPVISVLDQKRLNGPVLVDGKELDKGGNFSQASTLWHDSVGYKFDKPASGNTALSVDFGARESDWSDIGISEAPKSSVDLFSAWVSHGTGSHLAVPTAYTAFPAVTSDEFQQKSQQTALQTISNDQDVSALYDLTNRIAMFVFWQKEGGKATFTPSGADGFVALESSGNSVVIYNLADNSVTVSDPSQTLKEVRLTIARGLMDVQNVNIALPTGGEAGKSVTQKL
ncbi:galactose mutarotase-like protein [Daedaleopsis nitida]|nr:galactose mutarotase-like protein [Daedaleopsis nitida]